MSRKKTPWWLLFALLLGGCCNGYGKGSGWCGYTGPIEPESHTEARRLYRVISNQADADYRRLKRGR